MRRLHTSTPITGVFIVRAKSGAATLPYAVLKEELTALVHKTGMVR